MKGIEETLRPSPPFSTQGADETGGGSSACRMGAVGILRSQVCGNQCRRLGLSKVFCTFVVAPLQ